MRRNWKIKKTIDFEMTEAQQLQTFVTLGMARMTSLNDDTKASNYEDDVYYEEIDRIDDISTTEAHLDGDWEASANHLDPDDDKMSDGVKLDEMNLNSAIGNALLRVEVVSLVVRKIKT